MKRLIALILAVLLALGGLSGCGVPGEPPKTRLHVVTTIFPVFDWTKSVLGDDPAGADVTWLLSSGVDMHSYQPTAANVVDISTCDLFVFVGGESDAWVRDALRQAENRDMIVVDLMDALGDAAKTEEAVEGMQTAEPEDEAGLDEHVWLSLQNAAVCVSRIADALGALDPDHADTYRANAAAYREKLTALDTAYRQAVAAAPTKTLLFADRFPFRYLADDYGLSYYAAFPGCSAETEASFETVTFLSDKADELGLSAVLTIEGGDHRLAETIVRNTASGDQRILTLDSMQATTLSDYNNGATYLSVMEQNLSVLKQALSR